ncbi:hypothetical protein V5799_032118 [Amblyomma americanum]|uniref:Uncharacterized protein n=1 Tax=Amblyomma americanum TaxID=6943 RepID=A0AAQ4DS42_AMBAM
MEEEQVPFLFEQDLFADVFKRMLVLWKQEFLPQITRPVRRNYSQVSVAVTGSVDKGLLREFFDAVASSKTLRVLHFYPSDNCFDEVADGVASVVKRTTTLKVVQNLMHVEEGCEQQLLRVLDALKENRSVINFTMYVELLTPEIATSLSELLAVNDALRDVEVCGYWGIRPEEVETILGGLRKNHTLTGIMVTWDGNGDAQEGLDEMEELLKRNARLLDQAVSFVTGDCTNTETADAARILRDSAGLVEKLEELTGKTEEAVLWDIETAVSGLSK